MSSESISQRINLRKLIVHIIAGEKQKTQKVDIPSAKIVTI